jgi:2'-phosphotransferase
LDAWEKIKTEGLKKMRRNHIHFGANANALSGMRRDAEVVIYLDIEAALRDGVAFYISSNGVILSPGVGPHGVVAPKYFKSFRIRNREV